MLCWPQESAKDRLDTAAKNSLPCLSFHIEQEGCHFPYLVLSPSDFVTLTSGSLRLPPLPAQGKLLQLLLGKVNKTENLHISFALLQFSFYPYQYLC